MEQTKRSYLDFVSQIDTLTDHEVIWQPYIDTLVAARALQCSEHGLICQLFGV
jgi:hypothetical protein